MSESLKSEFFGHGKGSSDRKSENELWQERAKGEVPPSTPVQHVIGSELFHPDRQCKTLIEEEKQSGRKAIGRLYGEMKELNRRVQRNELPISLKLNETGELELCLDCDKKKITTTPKDPYAGI